MSVPLDRLYNFLHDVCNHRDLIIYRFFPHGSRKITDLTQLATTTVPNFEFMLFFGKKIVFFHDQEPLNFDLYSSYDIDQLQHHPMMSSEIIESRRDLALRVMPEMNLRWAAGLHVWRYPILLIHSEKRSKELARYKDIKFFGVYWWCHALIARDWFRYAEHDHTLDQTSHKKEFLIYNRAWSGTREYRLKFIELLILNNLADHCMTWFSPIDDQHYTMHTFKNPDLHITNYSLENYFSPSQIDSTASADYCAVDYQQTSIEVVLETLFDDARLHLTEKTLRPIACGHPFILLATHRSLEYLRSYGFETFSPWIDETYDTIEDPAQRLKAVVQEMQRIANLSEDKKTVLYAGLKDIAIRNKKLFFSDAWQQSIVDEYKTNFDQALKQLNQF